MSHGRNLKSSKDAEARSAPIKTRLDFSLALMPLSTELFAAFKAQIPTIRMVIKATEVDVELKTPGKSMESEGNVDFSSIFGLFPSVLSTIGSKLAP